MPGIVVQRKRRQDIEARAPAGTHVPEVADWSLETLCHERYQVHFPGKRGRPPQAKAGMRAGGSLLLVQCSTDGRTTTTRLPGSTGMFLQRGNNRLPAFWMTTTADAT